MKKVIYCSQIKRFIEKTEDGQSVDDIIKDIEREREKRKGKRKSNSHLCDYEVECYINDGDVFIITVTADSEESAKSKIAEMYDDAKIYSIRKLGGCSHIESSKYTLSNRDYNGIYGTDNNIYLHKAKQCIADYMYYEFDSEPDFGDLSHIDVAYTTEENPITGKESEIQTYVDLINFKVVTEIDDIVVDTIKYNTLGEFIDSELQWLDFDSLVRTDDEMWDIVNRR